MIRVRLYRGTTQSDELGWREQVSVGDVLSLEVELTRPLYIYVWNRDSTGHETLLFPLTHLDTGNPLASGHVYRLPGPSGGIDRFWEVESGGGDEQLWVVAAESAVGTDSIPDSAKNRVLQELGSMLLASESTEHDSAAPERARGFLSEEVTLPRGETVWVSFIELRGES
ncbi:MAG TPA: DUF4384 domain-containing protein [Vicinamibacteria bacterium]|nr:DUF4384 domain-containing protein [Vicinamibacteria bacterium]